MTFPTRLLAPGEDVYLDSLPHWSLLFWPTVLVVAVLAGCVAVVVLWPSAPIWMGWVLLGIGVAALANLLARYVIWRTKSFVVTSQRIVYRTGIVRRTGREISIARVQDVTYHQTVVERIVRAGSLTVESAGRQGQDPFPDIRRPDEVQALINRVVGQAASGYAAGGYAAGGYAAGGYAAGGYAAGQNLETAPARPPLATPIPDPPMPLPTSSPVATPTFPFPARPQAVPTQMFASPPITDPTPRVEPRATIAQQLKELADLHKHGVITDAEYEHKRQEFLDRL